MQKRAKKISDAGNRTRGVAVKTRNVNPYTTPDWVCRQLVDVFELGNFVSRMSHFTDSSLSYCKVQSTLVLQFCSG